MANPFEIKEPTCISFSGGRTSAYMVIKYYQPGDLVITANWIKPTLNDVALYKQRDTNGNIKQDVVHRVITLNSKNEYQFKGDNNESIDALSVPEADVVGKVAIKIPGVGNLYTPLGAVSVIAVIGGIWLMVVGIRRLRNK